MKSIFDINIYIYIYIFLYYIKIFIYVNVYTFYLFMCLRGQEHKGDKIEQDKRNVIKKDDTCKS